MMLLRAISPHFGISFVNADVAADFLRVKLAEIKANASRLNPADPGSIRLFQQLDITGPPDDPFVVPFDPGPLAIVLPDGDVTDFRTAVDTVRATLSQAGVERTRLIELNAFPDLQLSETVGEIIPRIENLLRIFDTTVRGISPPTKPSALPLAVGISLSFIVIGAVIFYFVTKR